MVRSAFLFLATLVVTCVGCAPVPATTPTPLAQTALVAPATCPAIANVNLVAPNFTPTGSAGIPPALGPAPSNMQADLLAAHAASPNFFKAQLCGLDGIFITQQPQSWGYRDINTGRRFIAISTSLWGPSGPISLAQYENRVLGPPLSWPQAPADPSPPVYLPSSPNTGTITLLSALAHEFGHVLWADVLVSPRGTPPQAGRFCSRILNDAWVGALQPGVWRAFEAPDDNPADIQDDAADPPPAGDPGPGEAKVLRIIRVLREGHIDRAHRILARILAPGRPFPSFLGAFSANEQFVETFVLYTLIHAPNPLTSLPLQVSPGVVRDIPATLPTRRRLNRVLACFDSVVNPPPR